MITTDYPPIRGGISSVVFHLASNLARQGHEVEVVAPAWKGDEAHDREDPCRVFRTPGYNWGYLRGIPLLAKAAQRLLARPPELILPMNVAYGGLAMLLLKVLGLQRPYAMLAHGLEFTRFQHSPVLRRLYLRVYAGAEQIFANSDFTRRRLADFGVTRPIDLMHPGVDTRRFSPEGPNFRSRLSLEGRPILGTLSRLVERKGLDMVLRALPRVLAEFPQAVYLVVGDGPDRPRLEGLAEELGVASAVRFAGEAGEETLPDWFRTCDVFVLPSREIQSSGHVEGFGIVFLEAGACGIPVIGGRSGGVVEAVQDGVTGVLVNPGDSEDLAEALLKILRNPDRARAMGQAGRTRAERAFTWENAQIPFAEFVDCFAAGKPS